MDLRQLNTFVHVVELKSVTRAAEHLNTAQPALGLQIRKLEEELQVQLLVRHSRGVEPTEAGRLLLDHARDILERAAQARSAMAAFTGPPRGRVLLGLTPSTNYMISPALIKACARDAPEIVLSIEEQLSAVLLEWTRAERLEFCLAHRHVDAPNLAYQPLFRESLYFICAPGTVAADATTISLTDVAMHALIMPGLPHGLRKLIEDKAAKAGLALDISFEMQSTSVVQDLVAAGIGSTILPFGGAQRSVADGELQALRIVDPSITREIYLCAPQRHAPSPAGKLVRDLITTVVRDIVMRQGDAWVWLTGDEDRTGVPT